MTDSEIVELFFDRNEQAINDTVAKYESYCKSIAFGILKNNEDAMEAVNDTWMSVWNCIPPHRPLVLRTFLGKLTRRAALNIWRTSQTKKRGGDKIIQALDELEECIASNKTIDSELSNKELGNAINSFLDTLPEQEQKVFVCRYWYLDSISEIARNFSYSESKVKSMLHRTRRKMAKYLEAEEIYI